MTELWNTGDIITADKLNITGIEIFLVNVVGTYDETTEETEYTADKTVEEIIAAVNAGKLPVVKYSAEGESIDNTFCLYNSGYYEDDDGAAYFSNGSFTAEIGDVPSSVAFMSVNINTDGVDVVTDSYNFPRT